MVAITFADHRNYEAAAECLNTTVGIIQPISPMYVVSKWSTGLDREFLLRLFIKSINLKEANGYHEYLNDPNSPVAMAAFSAKLHSWLPGISMRALTVLEPLGPTLDPSTVTSITTSEGNTRSVLAGRIERTDVANAANASFLGAYQHLKPLGGGSFYVGNAASRTPDGPLRLQLFREYPQQVVLCVTRTKLGIEPLASSSTPLGDMKEEEEALSNYALTLKAAAKGGAGKTSERSQFSGAAGAGTNGNAGFFPQQAGSLATNLKVDRVAAVLPSGVCGQHELVLPAYTEEENAKDSATYSHVEWRSIAEVIVYLGGVAAYPEYRGCRVDRHRPEWRQYVAHFVSALERFTAGIYAGHLPRHTLCDSHRRGARLGNTAKSQPSGAVAFE